MTVFACGIELFYRLFGAVLSQQDEAVDHSNKTTRKGLPL